MTDAVPVIDLTDESHPTLRSSVADGIGQACRETGFFCVVGHGVDASLFDRLDSSARAFFALPDATKAAMAMPMAGSAWRGWFPLGGEVTNGVPDRKEGIYFGQELDGTDQRVASGRALHGANLFPGEVPTMRTDVLEWISALTDLGHRLMSCIATGLGLRDDWFRVHLTADPTVLFRIFHYPDSALVLPNGAGEWGVAEHTDYGLLTMLAQDDRGGLQVRSRNGWVEVDPIPYSFVCNIGDMLERMTGGRYRSTPHRVRNTSGRNRLSFPFFFDPSWDAHVEPLPLPADGSTDSDAPQRWDGRSVFDFDGTYGDYLTAKVGRVFPDLVHVI